MPTAPPNAPYLPAGITPAMIARMRADQLAALKKKQAQLQDDKTPKDKPPIPNWDDIIKLDPGLPSPLEYLKFVGVQIGAIDLHSLSPETQKAVLRRLSIAAKMADPNVPKWRQAMIQAMTAIDNVEDIFSTFIWLFSKPIESTGRAGRNLVRITAKADIALNNMNTALRGDFLRGGKKPLLAKSQTNAILKNPELSRKQKHKMMNERMFAARMRRMRGYARTTGGKWLAANVGKLFQAAQASETLTGVGLQIGTIYGTLENALWDDATTLKTVFELFADRELRRLNFFKPEAQAVIAQRIRTNEMILAAQPDPWVVKMYDWITGNLLNPAYMAPIGQKISGSIDVIRDNPLYDADTHAMAITNYNLFLSMQLDQLQEHLQSMDHERFATLYQPPTRTWNAITTSILAGYGIQFNREGFPLAAARYTPVKIMDKAATDTADFAAHWRAWVPDTVAADLDNFLNCQFITTASLASGIMSTDSVPVGVENTLDEQLLLFGLDQAAMPPRDATQPQIDAWVDYMKAHTGPDLDKWRRGGFYQLNMDYWRAQGKQPAFFNN